MNYEEGIDYPTLINVHFVFTIISRVNVHANCESMNIVFVCIDYTSVSVKQYFPL